MMRVTVLGCGSSSGIPMIGCACRVCRSANPRNKRSRASIFIQVNGLDLLVDASPDLRRQCLDNGISHLDAVLLTHNHADHTHGMDDLRSFNYLSDAALPVFSDRMTIEMMKIRFDYAFLPRPEHVWFRPCLIPHIFPEQDVQDVEVMGVPVTVFTQQHGRILSLGFRFGAFAYSTDVDEMPEHAFEALEGVDTWIVDCLRKTPSSSHSFIDRTLEWIERVRPRRAILTHMAHDMEYDELAASLPNGVEPAYDGMVLEFDH